MTITERTISKADMILWLAAALILRLAAMPIAAHFDLIHINYFPSKLVYEGVWDIYGYINLSFGAEKAWTYYPPLTYFTIGAFQWLFKPIAAGFYGWITAVYAAGLDNWILSNGTSGEFFKYLFLIKAPYLFFDGICFFAIYGLAKSHGSRYKALALWAVNPAVLYGVYMFGQIDIMPASLAVLAVLLMARGKSASGFAVLGVAALFKTFTIFMVPPLLILVSRSWRDLARNAAAAAIPLAVVLVPFFFHSGGEVLGALFPKIYQQDAAMGFWLAVRKAAFLGFYFLLLAGAYKKRGRSGDAGILGVSLAAVLLLYVLFFAPVHYFVWAVPLLVAAVCLGMMPAKLYWALTALVFIYSLNNSGTTTGLFAPLNPAFFLGLPGLPDIMHGLGIRWGYVMLGAELAFIALCVMTAMALAGVSPACGKILGVRGS